MRNVFDTLSNAAKQTYFRILKVNITTDSFIFLKGANTQREKAYSTTKFSTYISLFADNGMIYPDDELDYRKCADLPHISRYFREDHGKNIYWTMFRCKFTDAYHWMVTEMLSAEDYSDENQTVYLLLKDVSESVKVDRVTLTGAFRALCENFDSIYCLDLQSGSVIPYRYESHGFGTLESYLKSCPTYEELIQKYIQFSVLEQDRPHVARITAPGFIQEWLQYKAAYSGEYRVNYEGKIHWYRIKFARMDASADGRYVAIGLTDICDEKRMELDLYRGGKTVLVVDGCRENREALERILKDGYVLRYAATGAEALAVLEQYHQQIAVIVMDLQLGDMTGGELISRIKATHEFSAIPVIISAPKADAGTKEGFYTLGAEDYIIRPYSAAIVKNRVDFMVRYREATNMLSMVETDSLTGLYTKEFFYKRAEQLLKSNPEKDYAICITDIENFRFYNARYGSEAGGRLLKTLAGKGAKKIPGYVIGGRLDGDIFAAVLENPGGGPDIADRIAQTLNNDRTPDVTIKAGVYLVEDVPVNLMCDCARLAKNTILGVFNRTAALYDDNMKEALYKREIITNQAEDALAAGQFRVYYQPKMEIRTGLVGGAEALVRWIHPQLGFLSPGEFIPMFEHSGFIHHVDEYVLGEVCRALLRWQEAGIAAVPVSVNVSRADFDQDDLAQRIIGIVDSYGLPHSLIHLEITESTYSTDPKKITGQVRALHDAGFSIELDDFGVGYSSLSALDAIPIDVLKLDISLLKSSMASQRSMLRFSMKIAKLMGVRTVQEGVETEDQLLHVKNLDCDFVQGFYFSGPVPEQDFLPMLRRT